MTKTKQKFCVMGATSFGGRAVINSLLLQGHNVLGVARRNLPLEPFKISDKNLANLNWLQADLVMDTGKIASNINSFAPDYIIDFMGQGMVAHSWAFPYQWYNTNISKKSELLNNINWKEFLKLYIRISTPEVFGSVDEAITENHVFNPSTPYAVSHAAMDQHLNLLNKHTSFPSIIARYANFYGPGQQLYRIIPKAIYYALTEQKLTLDGGGLSERAFIYKDDIASSIDALITKGQTGEAYHFSDNNCVSIRSLVHNITTYCDIDFNKFIRIGADRSGKDQRYFMSGKKARESLGWHPKTSLEQGISKTINWVKKYKDFITPDLLNYHHNYRETYERNS